VRKFNEVIFCGNGNYSKQLCDKLKERLGEGISILSGSQQPGHPETAQQALEEEQWEKQCQADLTDVVRDIAAALGCGNLLKEPEDAIEEERPETGPMKFGDDWRGLFIRGDNAFYYWTLLIATIKCLDTKDQEQQLRARQLERLRDLLYQAVQNQLPNAPPITPDSEVQHMKPFNRSCGE
jgi:hypothetical protein